MYSLLKPKKNKNNFSESSIELLSHSDLNIFPCCVGAYVNIYLPSSYLNTVTWQVESSKKFLTLDSWKSVIFTLTLRFLSYWICLLVCLKIISGTIPCVSCCLNWGSMPASIVNEFPSHSLISISSCGLHSFSWSVFMHFKT